jgi:hypothetical protein
MSGHRLVCHPRHQTQKSLDNICTSMIAYAVLSRQATLRRPPKQANPFAPILLRTLRPSEKSQVPSNQYFPDPFVKTPGVGGTCHSPLGTELSAPARRTGPLFSYCYESLFPPARRTFGGQLLCFHIHANPRGVYPTRTKVMMA